MAAGDLVSLSAVKPWLNIASGDTSKDTILAFLISSCSSVMEAWMGRDICQATYTENYDGTGTSRLMLNQKPITAVSSITINGIVIPVVTDPLASGVMFDENGLFLVGSIVPYYLPGNAAGSNVGANNVFNRGSQNVAVVYTAGYATVPMGLQQACIDFVGHKFAQRGRIGMKSDHIGVSAQGSAYDTDGIPDMVKAAMKPFKRWAPLS